MAGAWPGLAWPAVALTEPPWPACISAPPPLPSRQVATHAAVELGADKLLVITGEDVRALSLPHYLPLVRVKGLGLFVRARGALGWLPACLPACLPAGRCA